LVKLGDRNSEVIREIKTRKYETIRHVVESVSSLISIVHNTVAQKQFC